MSPETVESGATGPNTSGSACSTRHRRGTPRPEPPRARHPAGPCPDRAPQTACATAPVPPPRGVETTPADRLDQQHRSGLRNRPAAPALDVDTRVQPDTLTHLESGSFLQLTGP